jgi:hypothetical protein
VGSLGIKEFCGTVGADQLWTRPMDAVGVERWSGIVRALNGLQDDPVFHDRQSTFGFVMLVLTCVAVLYVAGRSP